MKSLEDVQYNLNEQQLQTILQEIIIRFNTDPRRYEKKDFSRLILAIISKYNLDETLFETIFNNINNLNTEVIQLDNKIDTEVALLDNKIDTEVNLVLGSVNQVDLKYEDITGELLSLLDALILPDADINDKVNKLLDTVFPLTVKMSSSNVGRVYEIGDVFSDVLSITATKDNNNIINNVTAKVNNVSTVIASGMLNISNISSLNKSFNVKVLYNLEEYNETFNYTFVHRLYAGNIEYSKIETLEDTDIINLSSQLVVKLNLKYTLNVAEDTESFVYAYPSTYGNLTEILDSNGFNCIGDFSSTNIDINNILYTVYYRVATSPLNQQFTFKF